MRDVLAGITRFDDLARDLGISRKVLAARLTRLVQEDVLVRERYQERPAREHYRATGKGKESYPVLLALMNWGDRWYSDVHTTNPRHRQMLQKVIDHSKGEAACDLDAVLATLSPNPCYHFWSDGHDVGPKGMEAVVEFYQ